MNWLSSSLPALLIRLVDADAVGGVSFPDGVGLTFVDNSHLDFVGAASGPPAVRAMVLIFSVHATELTRHF